MWKRACLVVGLLVAGACHVYSVVECKADADCDHGEYCERDSKQCKPVPPPPASSSSGFWIPGVSSGPGSGAPSSSASGE
jgi:hypothetical protein